MRFLVLFALLSVAAAKPKPGGLYSGWDGGLSLGHESFSYAQPALTVAHAAPVIQAAPIVHAAPVYHAAPVIHAAPVAVAKAATSYSSFQRVVHPVAHQVVAQPVVHAAPAVVHAPVAVAHAPVATYAQSYGHGWGNGWGHGW